MTAPSAPRTALRQLCAAGFVAYCSYSMCRVPLLPLFAQQLGASAAAIGLVMGASTLTGVIVKLPAGALSDIFGRRRLLLIAAAVFATMPFTYLVVGAIAPLILLRFLHGSATAIFSPVIAATVSDFAPSDRRGSWLSTYSTLQGAGQALGPVIGGYLIAAGRFDLVFLVSGLIGVWVPVVVSAWGGTPDREPGGAAWPEFREGILEVAGDRLMLITSAAHAAQFVLNGTLNAFLPLYARDVLHLPAGGIGWLFATQTATTLVLRPWIGRLSDRVGRRPVIASGLTLCGSAVFALPAARSLGGVVAIIVIYAAGVAVTTAATSAYITDLTRRARYGAAHGVFGTIYDIGDALGPIAAGLLVTAIGYAATFRVMATVTIVMAAVFTLGSRSAAGHSGASSSARAARRSSVSKPSSKRA